MKSQVSKNRGNFLRGEGTKQQQKKQQKGGQGTRNIYYVCVQNLLCLWCFFLIHSVVIFTDLINSLNVS